MARLQLVALVNLRNLMLAGPMSGPSNEARFSRFHTATWKRSNRLPCFCNERSTFLIVSAGRVRFALAAKDLPPPNCRGERSGTDGIWQRCGVEPDATPMAVFEAAAWAEFPLEIHAPVPRDGLGMSLFDGADVLPEDSVDSGGRTEGTAPDGRFATDLARERGRKEGCVGRQMR